MLTLALDASTYLGTVALVRPGVVVGASSAAMRGEREERLLPAIAELLTAHGISVDQLEAVACGSGPGSFTSLRIAASIAKGICVARTLPLFVAPSPLLIIAGAEPPLAAGRYVAALDAMRGDLFTLAVDVDDGGVPRPVDTPALTSRADAERHAASSGAELVGPREARGMAPHARGFASLLRHGLAARVDLSAWEPDYGRKAEAQVRWERAHGRALEAR